MFVLFCVSDEFEELDTNSVPSGLEQVSLSISDLTDQVKELKLILPNLLYTDKEVVLNRTTVSGNTSTKFLKTRDQK